MEISLAQSQRLCAAGCQFTVVSQLLFKKKYSFPYFYINHIYYICFKLMCEYSKQIVNQVLTNVYKRFICL
jgi:hypothetical protein